MNYRKSFNYDSPDHGYLHTIRVLILILKIGEKYDPQTVLLSFLAGIIHDMHRVDDIEDPYHGFKAVKYKLHLFDNLFKNLNLSKKEIIIVKQSIINHSSNCDLHFSYPAYLSTAILKDADALDKVRFNSICNYSKLRLQRSIELIEFSHNLFFNEKDSLIEYLNILQLEINPEIQTAINFIK